MGISPKCMFALKRLTFAAAVAVLVLMSDSGPSQAGDFFLDQQRVVKPRLIIQRGETLRRRIRQIVEGRLRPDRPSVGPAGISALGAVISPVAAEADGSPLWGSWVDTSYTHLDGDEPGAPFDGPQVAVGTGLDYAVSERLVVGAEFNYDFAEIDNNFGGAGFGPGRLKSHSYGVGPYLGYAVTDNILFDASFTYSWGENDISDQVSTGSFDNEGWSATANLTGYVDLGSNLTLAPSAGIAYSYNRDDPFVDSAADFFPAQTIHTGVFNFGATLSYFHVLDDVRSIEPSISVEASYEFEIFGEPPLDSGLVASNVNDPGLALSVTGGLDITLSEAVSMSVTGGVGGIGRSNYLEASGGAQVGVQF